jgi:hypothetical protein
MRVMPSQVRRPSVLAIVASVTLACAAAGCSNTNRTPPVFRDLPVEQSANWTHGRRLWASPDGRTLNVAIDADPQDLYVGRIDYEVYEGNLYLATVRQARPFSPSLFEIDTIGMQGLNQPWQEHVYWVADVKWDSVTRRASTVGSLLGQRVDRVKADVTTAEPVPATQPVVRAAPAEPR